MRALLRNVGHLHFVGIGGVGMSALAELLARRGQRVSGSDLRPFKSLENLRALGIEISIGHGEAAVGDAEAVVHSTAIPHDNPELALARQRGLPVVSRGELLAEVLRGTSAVVVAGSHGKTTTTALVATVLEHAGLDPTALVGGRMLGVSPPSGVRVGKSEWCVVESDESDGSFLRLSPEIAVLTNLDPEHLDHWGSYAALQDAFAEFAARVPFHGAVVACADHAGLAEVCQRLERRAVTYGTSAQAEWRASEITPDGLGMRFRVIRAGKALGDVRVPLPGAHNVANALAALAVAAQVEVDFDVAREALEAFRGVERRFERRGQAGGVWVVDDYSHHPAEIRAALASARGVHEGRIVAVFQPHRYTRTRDLFDEFASAFEAADAVRLLPVYAASEPPIAGVDAEALARAVAATGHGDARFAGDLDRAAESMAAELRPGDLVVLLGAGDVGSLADPLLAALTEEGAE